MFNTLRGCSAVPVVLIGVLFGPAFAKGQTVPQSSAAPAFEVASVKPAMPPQTGGYLPLCLVPCTWGASLKVDGSRVEIRYYTIHDLIEKAYRLKDYELSPDNANTIGKTYWDWMTSQRFDIAAKIPDGASTGRIPEMLQELLATRFKLSLHRETRELRVYALEVDKNGPTLRSAAGNADAPVADLPGHTRMDTPQGEARFGADGYAIAAGPYGPIRSYADNKGAIHTDFLKITMAELVDVLGQDRPVIDRTNLQGFYQFSIERISQMEAAAAGAPPLSPAQAARDALTKAGLRLEAATAALDVVAIDHVEKTPTEN